MATDHSEVLISTLIPTYRRPQLLKRALRSVVSQTHGNLRICVFDNASGDETRTVVDEFRRKDSRVEYYCHPTNIGARQNFLFAAARVETPYFSFLSDDDILLPEFYQKAFNALQAYPEAGFCSTAVIHLGEDGRVYPSPVFNWKPGLYLPPGGLLSMLKYEHPTWTGTLFRKRVLQDVGTLDVDAVMDLDFELRAAAVVSFVIVPEPGAIFTTHSSSFSGTSRLGNVWPGWLKLMENISRHPSLPSHVQDEVNLVLRRRLRTSLTAVCLSSMIRGEMEEAIAASEILKKECHHHMLGSLLGWSVAASAWLPGIIGGLKMFRRVRRWLLRKRNHVPRQYLIDYSEHMAM